MKEIISAGLGGQSVLTSGLIIAKVAMDKGENVTWVPTYGSQMRGGPASCGVKIDPNIEIPGPFVKTPDILLAMSGDSIEEHEANMKENGIIVLNSSMVEDREYRKDLKVYRVPVNEIAMEVGNPRGMNLVLLGAFIKVTDMYTKEEFVKGMDAFFAERNIINEKNKECFIKGYESV